MVRAVCEPRLVCYIFLRRNELKAVNNEWATLPDICARAFETANRLSSPVAILDTSDSLFDPRRAPLLPCFSCIHIIVCLVLAHILASGCLKRGSLVMQASRHHLLENIAAHDLAVQHSILGRYQPPRSLAVVSHLPGTDTGHKLAALPTILGTCRLPSLPFPVLRMSDLSSLTLDHLMEFILTEIQRFVCHNQQL